MKLTNKLVLVSSLVAAVACGQSSKKKAAQDSQEEAPQNVAPTGEVALPTEAAPEASQPVDTTVSKPADLPAAAIVRVAIGADGQEDPSTAELRLETQPQVATSQDEAVKSFEKGQKPKVLKKSKDELDTDTSTQSWFFGRFFRNYNYSYNYSYNYYPTYYAGYNNYYSYGSPNYYGNVGGYNYYYYPYSGYGYGSSYGYGYGYGRRY